MNDPARSIHSKARRWLMYGTTLLAVFGLIAVALATFHSPLTAPGTTSLPPRSLAAAGWLAGKTPGTIPDPKPYGVEVVSAEAFGTIASLAAVPDVPRSPRPTDDDAASLPKYLQAGPQSFQIDNMLQTKPGALESLGSPIANFAGMGIAEAGGYLPPDTQGDIGYDSSTGKRYYFQWVNVTYKVWDVTNPAAPSVVISTTQGNALWAAALPGSECALRNHGDPITLFDEQAGRWFISQFALGASFSGPFHQCIAVSQTANPAGAWYVYDFPYRNATTYLNDYPHFGVWPDATYNAYYMTVHQFNAAGTAWLGQAAAAYDRAKILAGDPGAQAVYFDLYSVNQNFGGMLPADLDGTPPPTGTPGLFFEVDDNTAGMGADALRVWELKPNWTTPASSTFGVNGQPNYTVTVASFNLLPCTTAGTRTCIPQAGTSQKLDAIGDRLMYRAAFRTIGATQSVVINHTVLADGTDRAGIRWYETRRNPADGSWSIYQQGTYAPADGQYRWMGSVAMDASGDIALGYSASSSTVLSTIRYAGRAASDPLNTLPQTEITMTTSSGSQTSTYARWGDYSMMGVDPVDGCTFWYTQEYHGATSSSAWQTRIGSFRFPECGSAGFAINASPATQEVCQNTDALYTVGVGSFGNYSDAVTLSTAGNPGTASFVPNPVTPPANSFITSTLTLAGATAGNYTFNITGTDALTNHVTSVQLNVVGAAPVAPTLVSPANGATSVLPSPTLTWNAIPNTTSYYLEIATDAAFNNVVYTATVAGTSHLVGSNLPSNTQLYWRVRAANICGTGAFATPFSFTTANFVYATYCATPNLAIPDNNATGVTSTIVVTRVGTLVDLNLIISGTHTWVGDLIITTTKGLNNVSLLNRPATGTGSCSGNDLPNLTLDDDPGGTPGTSFQSSCASGTNPAQAYAANGSYTPLSALSAFDGQPLKGTWNLQIADRASADTGTLQKWCLAATFTSPPVVYAHPSDATCGGNTPCYSGSTAIQQALNDVASGGQVIVQSSHSVNASLLCAGDVTIAGTSGAGITWTGGAGDLFTAQNCNLQVKGLTLNGGGTATIFDQLGTGTVTAYANNISNFAAADAGVGTPQIGHNYWGTNDPAAPAPTGMPAAEWPKRLGALIAHWAEGTGSAMLVTGVNTATLSGGGGIAVLVSHGRGQANAPFGNGVAPYVNQMCSDFYDLFTINGSGTWTAQIPVDNAANCNTNTLTPKRVDWITALAACSPATNTACWNAIDPTRINVSGQNLLIGSLTVGELGGTPFVAGDINGLDPTAIRLTQLNGQSSTALPWLPLGVLIAIGLSVGLLALKRRQA
jgi:subtilisin-like proprotein convertase family protein